MPNDRRSRPARRAGRGTTRRSPTGHRTGAAAARTPPAGQPRGPRSVQEEIRQTARAGQAERALRSFDQAVSLLERDRAAAAIAPALEAKGLASRSGAVREVLGIALYRAERYQDALRELRAYRRITGRLDQNHLIADSLRALGQPEKAIEPAREAVGSKIPDEARAEAAVVGAAALADLGRYSEALGLVRAVPTDARRTRQLDLRLWYVTGDILARSGRSKEAVEQFRKILRHDPAAFDAAERVAALE